MIRFENTGSADAINIVVKDTIDTEVFDISTVEVLIASHSVETSIRGDMIVFIFKDVNLPFDDANNDGYVTFQIKPLATIDIGTNLENRAAIYFDFNFPIITNTTSTVVNDPTSTVNIDQTKNRLITDNPITGTLHLTESFDEYDQIVIYNNIGQEVLKRNIMAGNIDIDISELASGSFILKAIGAEGSQSKIVIIIND